MTMDANQARQVGRHAAAAAVLMAAGVGGELVFDPQRSDGTVLNPAVFAICLGMGLLGFGFLLAAARGLGTVADARSRGIRWGSKVCTIGAVLLVLCGVTVLVTGLASGAPAGIAFVPFGLGMLLLSVGPVVLGLAMRRQSHVRGLWALLVVSGIAAFAAIAIPLDPWHDITLFTSYAAWAGAGALLLRAAGPASANANAKAVSARALDSTGG